MSENDKEEFRNAIRQIGYYSMNLDNPHDRVRVSEWVRKLISMDDNSENIKSKNEYIQFLRIQVNQALLQPPFTKPPPNTELPPLPEVLGNIVCEKVPGLPKPGQLTPAVIHKSPDGRAYISIKHVPGDGVLCYMAVTPDPAGLEIIRHFHSCSCRHVLYECGKARKSFSCDECGKKVTRQDTLQKHKLIHLVQHLKKKESEGDKDSFKPKKICP